MAASRLLRTPDLRPHESFMGYGLRLTEENGYDSPGCILKATLCQRNLAYFHDISADFSLLSSLTGVPSGDLREMTYYPAGNGGSGSKVHAYGFIFPRSMIRLPRPRICPLCIKETGYIHAIWEFVPVTACPIHNLLLMEECPGCRKPLSWNRSALGVCRCKCDWLKRKYKPLDDYEVAFARLVYQRCGLIAGSVVEGMPEGRNPLHSLDLNDIISAVYFIASQFGDVDYSRFGSTLPNPRMHSFMTRAYSVFERWPEGFHDFLQEIRKQERDVAMLTGMRKEFGNSFFVTLFKTLSSSQFDFLRDEFELFMREKWDGGYYRMHRKLPDDSPVKRKYRTLVEARKSLKISHPRIVKLIDDGLLQAVVKKNGANKTMYLIEDESLASARSEIELSVSFDEAERILGIGQKVLKGLIRSGLIEASRMTSRTSPRFERSALEKLLSKIESRVELGSGNDSPELNFREALQCCSRYNIKAGDLARAIIDGDLLPFGMDRRRGFHGLSFRKAELSRFLRGYLLHEKNGNFSIEDMARILNVNAEAVYHFARAGFIHAIQVKTGGHAVYRIGMDALDTFLSEYVLTAKLAKKSGKSAKRVAEWLAKKGILPVSGPGIDGGRQYLFRASDIVHLDLRDA